MILSIPIGLLSHITKYLDEGSIAILFQTKNKVIWRKLLNGGITFLVWKNLPKWIIQCSRIQKLVVDRQISDLVLPSTLTSLSITSTPFNPIHRNLFHVYSIIDDYISIKGQTDCKLSLAGILGEKIPIPQNLPKLEKMYFYRSCPNLRHLSLEFDGFPNWFAEHGFFPWVQNNFPNMTSLSIVSSDSNGFSSELLNFSILTQLRSLSFQFYISHLIQANSFRKLKSNEFKLPLNLTKLEVSTNEFDYDISHSEHLEQFVLYGTNFSSTVGSLPGNLKKIKIITVGQHSPIDISYLDYLNDTTICISSRSENDIECKISPLIQGNLTLQGISKVFFPFGYTHARTLFNLFFKNCCSNVFKYCKLNVKNVMFKDSLNTIQQGDILDVLKFENLSSIWFLKIHVLQGKEILSFIHSVTNNYHFPIHFSETTPILSNFPVFISHEESPDEHCEKSELSYTKMKYYLDSASFEHRIFFPSTNLTSISLKFNDSSYDKIQTWVNLLPNSITSLSVETSQTPPFKVHLQHLTRLSKLNANMVEFFLSDLQSLTHLSYKHHFNPEVIAVAKDLIHLEMPSLNRGPHLGIVSALYRFRNKLESLILHHNSIKYSLFKILILEDIEPPPLNIAISDSIWKQSPKLKITSPLEIWGVPFHEMVRRFKSSFLNSYLSFKKSKFQQNLVSEDSSTICCKWEWDGCIPELWKLSREIVQYDKFEKPEATSPNIDNIQRNHRGDITVTKDRLLDDQLVDFIKRLECIEILNNDTRLLQEGDFNLSQLHTLIIPSIDLQNIPWKNCSWMKCLQTLGIGHSPHTNEWHTLPPSITHLILYYDVGVTTNNLSEFSSPLVLPKNTTRLDYKHLSFSFFPRPVQSIFPWTTAESISQLRELDISEIKTPGIFDEEWIRYVPNTLSKLTLRPPVFNIQISQWNQVQNYMRSIRRSFSNLEVIFKSNSMNCLLTQHIYDHPEYYVEPNTDLETTF